MGDTVAKALALTGITEARVSAWLGRPCGCDERRQKLNALSLWAVRTARGTISEARIYFESLLDIER